MNARPDPFGGNGFGAPPATTGMQRLMPHLKTVAAGGFVVTLLFMGAQKLLPDGWRPSDIAGVAAGSTERHEIEEKQAAKIAYEKGLADATAQAQAQAQADLAAEQAVIEQRTNALNAQANMADLSDTTCAVSTIFGMLGAGVTGKDWHNAVQAVGQIACGAGDAIRSNMTREQVEALRAARATVRDKPD